MIEKRFVRSALTATILFSLLPLCVWPSTGLAEVHVFIQDIDGLAAVQYECTAGEIVRAFALDVSVDRGQIVGISGFIRGPSTAENPGYGIFPASYRDHFSALGATNINWGAQDYTPLAVPADAPADTLPGLNSRGVTLEFGALWDPAVPEAAPKSAGTLCVLSLSEPAKVSITPNLTRGGIVSAFSATVGTPVFTGGPVGPLITQATSEEGMITLLFVGGELQVANTLSGPWVGTGNTNGIYVETTTTNEIKFYRVRGL